MKQESDEDRDEDDYFDVDDYFDPEDPYYSGQCEHVAPTSPSAQGDHQGGASVGNVADRHV